MRRLAPGVFLLLLTLDGCAPAGYHYEAGSFTPTPNDPCWRPEVTSPGAVTWLNSTIGHPNGVPSRVIAISNAVSADRIQLSGLGYRFPSEAGAVVCHAVLTFTDSSRESGVVSLYDPGRYAPLQVEWVPDTAIARHLADADRLRTSKSLLVKPDLTTPAIQQCVGEDTALGHGEQFPGQAWAACAHKLGYATQ